MALTPSKPYDRETSWARLCEKISHQARHGFSKWAVTEKASGKLIGECGVHYFEGGPDIELGYRLARACWGHGFASEAAQACLDWALAERPEQVVAIVHPANTRSAQVLRKIGMIRAGTLSRLGHQWDMHAAIRRPATTRQSEITATRRSPAPLPARLPRPLPKRPPAPGLTLVALRVRHGQKQARANPLAAVSPPVIPPGPSRTMRALPADTWTLTDDPDNAPWAPNKHR